MNPSEAEYEQMPFVEQGQSTQSWDEELNHCWSEQLSL